jgi:hypothetical protein
MTGYQSHLALVSITGDKKGFIAPPNAAEHQVADELVVFESAQCVPKYVLYVKV